MKHRRVGNSGLSVSEVGYGNWLTHGSQVDRETSIACVRAALDAGITYFDTADTNQEGTGESILGEALRGVDRDSVVISSKVFYPRPPYSPNTMGLGRKNIITSANASLRRLGTDYIDIYLAQRFDRHTRLEESLTALADLVRQGKVLYVGVSEWTADQITRAVPIADELHLPLIANSPQYSMVWRVPESQVMPACDRAGMGQLAWQPLMQGVLTGKYTFGQPPPPDSRAADRRGGALAINGLLKEDLLGRVERLAGVANEAGLTLAQLAIAWVLQNDSVSSTIVGASRPEQLGENAKASGVRLDLEMLGLIHETVGRAAEENPLRTLSP